MAKKTFKAEDIINKLCEAEVLTSQGKTVSEVCRALGISDQTYYRWRKEYGGIGTEQAKRLKASDAPSGTSADGCGRLDYHLTTGPTHGGWSVEFTQQPARNNVFPGAVILVEDFST